MFGYGWDMMWGGGLWMILFWIFVIALTIGILRWLFAGSNPPEKQKRHLDRSTEGILKERYARGKIDREEYYELLDELHEGGR